MKTHIYKLATIVVATALLHSCSVDDYKVEGELTEETLIRNEASARSALNGVYDSARPSDGKGVYYTSAGLMVAGIEQQKTGGNFQDFYDNNVKPSPVVDPDGLYRLYQKSYKTINLANLFIKVIEKKKVEGLSETAKKSMIAEAKSLRANTYFILLKVFGQFYDSNSEYGVITTTKVIDGFTHLKRAKVSETYAQIISDLEYAIKYAPNKERDLVSQTFAKGLLAKVYLYKGGTENWAKTVRYCKEIISGLGEDAKFNLVENYPSIFKKSFKSKEVIFAPYYSKSEMMIERRFPLSSQEIKPSKYFKDLADKLVEDKIEMVPKEDEYGIIPGEFEEKLVTKYDPRFQFTFVDKIEANKSRAYNKYLDFRASTFYFLRVAEVYLICAEAIARTDGDMQTAVDMLNKVRQRAYSTSINPPAPFVFTDKATLLEDIRKEKMLELHLETAETWFDLVRYDRLGDLQASKLKSSITNANKLIFPIPLTAITNNPNFGKQNPGY